MSGHVFHPGHEALHGITVLVSGASGRTYLGRYHERTTKGVVLRDATVHEPGSDQPEFAEWIARQRRFGVRPDHRLLIVPEDEAGEIRRFDE